jgi:hypothetical protein
MKAPGMAKHSHSHLVVALQQGDVLRPRDPKPDYKEAGMLSDKKWIRIIVAMLAFGATGFHMYPGAKPDPAIPPPMIRT